MRSPTDLYLQLMKLSLLDLIYGPVTDPKFDPQLRRGGHDWPANAKTMIGLDGLNNIDVCMDIILRDQIPGDVIETGVWRGGACIFMKAFLAAHGVRDRRVWVADTFAGLPAPNPMRYPADKGDLHHTQKELAVPLHEVMGNFKSYDLLGADGDVMFLEGLFKDTLPTAGIEQLALIRLDGDMYESTITALEALYPKLSPGGYLIVDDYFLGSCRQAIQDYRKAHQIFEPIIPVNESDPKNKVFWRRTK